MCICFCKHFQNSTEFYGFSVALAEFHGWRTSGTKSASKKKKQKTVFLFSHKYTPLCSYHISVSRISIQQGVSRKTPPAFSLPHSLYFNYRKATQLFSNQLLEFISKTFPNICDVSKLHHFILGWCQSCLVCDSTSYCCVWGILLFIYSRGLFLFTLFCYFIKKTTDAVINSNGFYSTSLRSCHFYFLVSCFCITHGSGRRVLESDDHMRILIQYSTRLGHMSWSPWPPVSSMKRGGDDNNTLLSQGNTMLRCVPTHQENPPVCCYALLFFPKLTVQSLVPIPFH